MSPIHETKRKSCNYAAALVLCDDGPVTAADERDTPSKEDGWVGIGSSGSSWLYGLWPVWAGREEKDDKCV